MHPDKNKIIDYIYNELSDADRKEFEKHLYSCSECREIMSSFQNTSVLMDTVKGVEPSIELSAAVIDKVRTPQPESASGNDEILTLFELARFLKITESEVYELLSDIPYLKFAGRIRFRKSSIEKWLEISEENPVSGKKEDFHGEYSFKLWRDVG